MVLNTYEFAYKSMKTIIQANHPLTPSSRKGKLAIFNRGTPRSPAGRVYEIDDPAPFQKTIIGRLASLLHSILFS